ncbi:MAG: DUF308 domain-containing protein [Nitrosomonas sp.]|nr:DUF308 domain-containing protein [Nitrosomonas sp.]
MATLSVLKDNNSVIHLKQNHLGGWIIAIIGIGICYLPQIEPGDGGVWIVYFVGGVFAITGFLAAFYRLEVCLDLLQRKYRVVKGFWPNPQRYTGSFDDIEGLWFRKEWKTSGGKDRSKYLVWQTCLKFDFDRYPVCLYESRDESQALAYFENRARQLKVETFDHTGNSVKQRDWNKLDEPVSTQLPNIQYQAVDVSNPPQGLVLKKESGALSYVLPEPGLNGASIAGCLFGLPFFVMGIFSILNSIGLHEKLGWNINVSGSMLVAFILGIIFVTVGGFIIKFSIDYAFTKYQFSFYSDKFTYSTFIYDRMSEEKRFPHSHIEEFDLRDSTEKQRQSRYRIGGMEVSRYEKSDKQELYIRTNTEVVKLKQLKIDMGQFLRNVFYQNLEKELFSQRR